MRLGPKTSFLSLAQEDRFKIDRFFIKVHMRVSRPIQTEPSDRGSEIVFHGRHLHRPLLITILLSPIVSLLNGIAVFLYWKPKVVTTGRLDSDYTFEADGSTTVELAYYVMVACVFLHFVLGQVFVVHRGVRILIGQRTYQQRAKEAQSIMTLFILLVIPLFGAHFALNERIRSFARVEEVLDTDATNQKYAASAFVQLTMWGTLGAGVGAGWYWWLYTFSEKLQSGVRRWADLEVAEKRARQRSWHEGLTAKLYHIHGATHVVEQPPQVALMHAPPPDGAAPQHSLLAGVENHDNW